MKHRNLIAAFILTSLLVTWCFDAFAKPRKPARVITVGGIRAKEIRFESLDNPKYSNEYKSKRLSKLIGHKVDWKSITDQDYGGSVEVFHDACRLDQLILNGMPYSWRDLKDLANPSIPNHPVNNFKLRESHIDPSMAPVGGNDRAKRKN